MDKIEKNRRYDLFFNKFNSYLTDHRLKRTQERFTILRAIVELDDFFLMKTLFRFLKHNKYLVSKATLYNTISLMEKCGIVEKILVDGTLYYHLTDNTTGNYYLINEMSSIKIELDDKIEKSLISFVEKKYGVIISYCNIQFHRID